MNTHDVSNEAEYLHVRRQQKQALQNAQSVKGQRPRGTESRNELIERFMLQTKVSRALLGYQTIQSSFDLPAYAPCIESLDE